MSKKIEQKYHLVSVRGSSGFNDEIRLQQKHGFQPYGEVIVTFNTYHHHMTYTQQMIKTVVTEKNDD